MVDLLLTIGHHILVFSLVAVLAAEIAAIRPNMRADQIDHLARLDRFYGIIAGLVIIVGLGRVFFGAKGPDFFLSNPIFWAKILTFAAIGIISIAPTLRILKWRRAVIGDPSYSPGERDIVPVRNTMLAEAALLPLILIFAAMMVRGYGL